MSAPERIWTTDSGEKGKWSVKPHTSLTCTPSISYVRADLAPQWQDIATAPKDEPIDIWLKDGVRWCDCYYDRICSEWRTSRPSGRLLRIYEAHVSHWRHRPTPPEPSA